MEESDSGPQISPGSGRIRRYSSFGCWIVFSCNCEYHCGSCPTETTSAPRSSQNSVEPPLPYSNTRHPGIIREVKNSMASYVSHGRAASSVCPGLSEPHHLRRYRTCPGELKTVISRFVLRTSQGSRLITDIECPSCELRLPERLSL